MINSSKVVCTTLIMSMQHVMIITKWQLRQGFINHNDAHNTAIHEFVHLVDKMDGTMDGVPEIIPLAGLKANPAGALGVMV